MNVMPLALGLAAAFFWGAAQVLGKLAVRDLNSTIFNAIRFTSVALALTPLVLATGFVFRGPESVALAVASGALGLFIGTEIYFYSMRRAPAHRVIPIGNSAPVWTVVIAVLLLGERITTLLPISVGLVIVGTFLLVPKKRESRGWGPAVPLALFVALVWGINQVMRKYAVNMGMGVITFLWISIIAAAVSLNLTAVIAKSWRCPKLNRRDVGLSISSGILGHLVGNFCFLLALESEKVSSLAPVTSATIPFGFLLSVLIVKERPTQKAVIGMAIVFLGVVLAAL